MRRYAAFRLNKTTAASAPAITDPTSTPILTSSAAAVPYSNASSPINNETVNPMPASSDTPRTSRQARSSSRLAWVNLASRNAVRNTPSGLPITRPAMTPSVTGSSSEAPRPDQPPTVTPAAKNANTGTATPADTGRSLCSNSSAVGWPYLPSTGTVKPKTTPATVACTPLACTSAQADAASGTSTHQ